VWIELSRSGASAGTAAIGASFPFPLATWEVGYLNGHRPFRLGGGNGSKCPIAAIPRYRASLIRRPRALDSLARGEA
jgi:hypothetical protein